MIIKLCSMDIKNNIYPQRLVIVGFILFIDYTKFGNNIISFMSYMGISDNNDDY